MENEMEEINKETKDEFMLVTTQANSLLKGYGEFLEERISKSWNPFSRLSMLSSLIKNTDKVISVCNIQKLHLEVVRNLHSEFAASWRKINENIRRL
jgi:hypothetical protein